MVSRLCKSRLGSAVVLFSCLLAVGSGAASAQSSGTLTTTGNMVTVRGDQTSTLFPNGLVLVTGGEDSDGNPLATAELYNPATGTFAATGSMNYPRIAQTATLLNGGEMLIAGGYELNGCQIVAIAAAELYNPSTGAFTLTGNLNTPRIFPTATLLPNGQGLIAGGPDGNGGALRSGLRRACITITRTAWGPCTR
jgi:hypothetical protein